MMKYNMVDSSLARKIQKGTYPNTNIGLMYTKGKSTKMSNRNF